MHVHWEWWHMLLILALERQRQEDCHKFEPSLFSNWCRTPGPNATHSMSHSWSYWTMLSASSSEPVGVQEVQFLWGHLLMVTNAGSNLSSGVTLLLSPIAIHLPSSSKCLADFRLYFPKTKSATHVWIIWTAPTKGPIHTIHPYFM